MNEALRKGLNDRMEIANQKAQTTAGKGLAQGQMIAQAMNGATQLAQQAIGTYAQSQMRVDAPELRKRLQTLADEYANPDSPDAYSKYLQARKDCIDEYVNGKSAIFKGVFDKQFRASFEDDAFNYFDEKITDRIANKNLSNAKKIIQDSTNAFANHEDMGIFENNVIYKTVADADGIHVVTEPVSLKDTWATDLPTDTDDEKQNEKNRKANDFNRLLNIHYSAYALTMDMEKAHATVQSEIPSIEADVMKGEIFWQVNELSKNGFMNGERHFTDNEMKEYLRQQYEAGIPTPYTNREISAMESMSWNEIIDTTVDYVYGKMYADNKKDLIRDADGYFKASIENETPITFENLCEYLQSKNMISIESDGTINAYGLDDDMWTELQKIGHGNDRLIFGEMIMTDERYWGVDGVLDITDFPADLKGKVVEDAFGNFMFSTKVGYMTLTDTFYTESTVRGLRMAGTDIKTLESNVNGVVDTWVQNGQLPDKELRPYSGDSVDTNDKLGVAKSIWFTYLTDAGMSDAFARDYIETNSHVMALDLIVADYDNELRGVGPYDIDTFKSANTKLVGDINPYEPDRPLTKEDIAYINEKQSSLASSYSTKESSEWGKMMAEDSQNLNQEVDNARNKYVADWQMLTVIASDGYVISDNYSTTATGVDTCNMVFDIANMNLLITAKSIYDMLPESQRMKMGIADIDFNKIVTDDEFADLGTRYNGNEFVFKENRLEQTKLAQLIAYMTGGNAETIISNYNSKAVVEVQNNLVKAYEDFEKEVKNDKRYDKDLVNLPSWTDITKEANSRIIGTASKYGSFKVETSANGVFNGYMNRILAGDSPDYIRELARTDPLLSEDDTEKLLTMSNSEIFKQLAGNGVAYEKVKDFIGQFDNAILQSYAWDAMYSVLSDAYKNGKMEDLPKLIQQATSAFDMAYGEMLPESMFTYEKTQTGESTVYGVPNFSGNGSSESDATKNKINEYSNAFWSGKFKAAGVDYIVNDYFNTTEGSNQFMAEIDKIAGSEGESLDRYCIVMALDAMGEDINTYNINPESDTFWDDINKYFGRLNRNNASYDARYADYILRVAGSMKSCLGMYGKESIDAIGNVVYRDFDRNVFTTTAMHDSAIQNGCYISYSANCSPLLNIDDGKGNKQILDISFTTEAGRAEIQKQIQSEIEEYASKNGVYLEAKNAMSSIWFLEGADSSFGTAERLMNDICQRIADISPTYKKYITDAKKALQYMDIPDKVGKAWYDNGSIHFEFGAGSIRENIKNLTGYTLEIDLGPKQKNNSIYSLIDDINNGDFKKNMPSQFTNALTIPKPVIGGNGAVNVGVGIVSTDSNKLYKNTQQYNDLFGIGK